MESCVGEGEWKGGVTGADAEVGALVWVVRRNGTWWPGQILGADELPENCVIPPRSTGTPIKLLGRPDGSIDWYNLKSSKRVKPFRCGEFDGCIEHAKVRGRLKDIAYNEGKCALREDAIVHALEIEMSRSRCHEPTNRTTKCTKENISSVQERSKTKMKIISFVTPSKESHKRDNSSLPQLDEGAMKRQALESDVVGLHASVEGAISKPTELGNNIQVYDVEMSAYGNYTGHALPLALLVSKSTGESIKGYPVTVEVLEDSFPASSADDQHPAISNFDCLMERRVSVPRQARSLRKPRGSRKMSEHDLGKSWRPHTRSFTSHYNSPSHRERSNRKLVVLENSMPPIRSTVNPASSPRKLLKLPSFPEIWRDSANRKPLVMKGSPPPSHLLPAAAIDDSGSSGSEYHTDSSNGEYHSDSGTNEYHSDSSACYNCCQSDSGADEYYVRPTTIFASSQVSCSPVASTSRRINGCNVLYLCSASTLCAPVRLV